MKQKTDSGLIWLIMAVIFFILAALVMTGCTAPAPVVYSLDDLMDVDLTGLDSGDILVKDGDKYIVVEGPGQIQYEDWQRYKTECYNDSTKICGYVFVPINPQQLGYGGYDEWQCRFTHRQPTFDGFMEWQNQYQTGGCYTIEDTTINGQTYLIGTK